MQRFPIPLVTLSVLMTAGMIADEVPAIPTENIAPLTTEAPPVPEEAVIAATDLTPSAEAALSSTEETAVAGAPIPPTPTVGTVSYNMIWDRHASPYMGANDIFFTYHSLIRGWDTLIGRPPSKDGLLRSAGRDLELLVWNAMQLPLFIIQHEVFGHGYRIRDLGPKYAKVLSYDLGFSEGKTDFSITRDLTPSQMTTLASAGIEAGVILADEVRWKWLAQGEMDGRETLLYSMGTQGLLHYALYSSLFGGIGIDGDDIGTYRYYLNVTYSSHHLRCSTLLKQSLLTLVDPFLVYTWLAHWQFILHGTPFPIPMIALGPYKYLPSLRTELTPYGPQYTFANFFVKEGHPLAIYLKYGHHAGNSYYGIDVVNSHLLAWKGLNVGYRFHAWKQPSAVLFAQSELPVELLEKYQRPKLLPEAYPETVLHDASIGAGLSLPIHLQIAHPALFLYLEPGYKMHGFIPGESLRAGPLLRGGFSIKF